MQAANKYSIYRTLCSITSLNIHDCTNYPTDTSVMFTCNEYFCQPLRSSIQDQVFDSFHVSSMCFGHHVEHFTKFLIKKTQNSFLFPRLAFRFPAGVLFAQLITYAVVQFRLYIIVAQFTYCRLIQNYFSFLILVTLC